MARRELTCICLLLVMITDSLGTTIQSRGSQFPRSARSGTDVDHDASELANPRVGPSTTRGLGASSTSGVKFSGGHTGNSMQLNVTRKRAFRRARRRAEEKGATWHRGRWLTAAELGTECHGISNGAALPIQEASRTAQREAWTAQPRLRVRCYNVGGITSEVYDHLQQWLLQKCNDDIVILQELHWGCGTHETIPGWNFYVTADAQHRHSGVAVIISEKVARGDEISFCTWIPGRLLHVRCAGSRLTLDVIAGYQWVRHTTRTPDRRSSVGFFLHKLGALLHGIPTRNMVVIGADWNTHCHPLAGHVGRGVMRTSHVRDVDLETFLQEHDLVFLNSWGVPELGLVIPMCTGTPRVKLTLWRCADPQQTRFRGARSLNSLILHRGGGAPNTMQ